MDTEIENKQDGQSNGGDARDCPRSAGSLEGLQGGLYLASLPKIVDGKLLKVEVDRWDAYGTEGYEMTVRLTTGLLSKRSLYDEELEGAEFFHLENT